MGYMTDHFLCHGSSKSRFFSFSATTSKPNERPPNFQTKVKTWALDWYSLKASWKTESRRYPETKPSAAFPSKVKKGDLAPSSDVPNKIIFKKKHSKHPLRAPGLSHITRRKVTSPNGNARWRKVTSQGGKSHHFLTIPMAQRHPTENQKVTKSSRDIAHSEICVDFRKKFAPNTNGTACAI